MKNEHLIDFYRIAFLSMKQKVTGGKANLAKPALLLSVFEAIEIDALMGNKILYSTVKPIYENLLGRIQAEPTPLRYPFFFMRSDGFWKLEWKPDTPALPTSPSDKFIRNNLVCASFDQALWDLLQDAEVRALYRDAVCNYYDFTIENQL